ncbi:MAG: alanine racemase [Nitrospirae bacterium]|nr:alanine racemase [Nitrospirota bacterium]
MGDLRAVAEIDLSALSHNLSLVKKKTGNKPVLAVVKAGAYGHGAVEVSRHLLKEGASMLGVAFTSEAEELREAGIKAPILVFFSRDNISSYLKHNLTPVVFDIKAAQAFSTEASRHNRKLPIHIKIDTGMGRLGFTLDSAVSSIVKIARMKNLELQGIMSHFSEADLKSKEFALKQLKGFTELIASLKRKNIHFRFSHISNSAAIVSLPAAHLDMVRPGIMLYGYGLGGYGLKPVLSLKSRVVMIKTVPPRTPISYGRTFITKRKSTIATIPIGYADGVNRKLSNCGEVLIRGRRVSIAGRVCMDTVIVDVTAVRGVKEGDEAVLIGTQGKERITAEDIAKKIGTISYEVLTSIGSRVRRVYKSS